MTASTPAPGGSSVGFLLSQLGYATSRAFRETLAPTGLEPRQFALLRLISQQQGRSQQAVADALQIPASRMVALLDDLEERGLLERRAVAADRRARALHLTARGRALLNKAWQLALASEQRTCAGLSPAQRDTLLDLLRRVAANYSLNLAVHPGLVDGHPGCPEQ
ncbi:MAG TPA: MarR family winged helix-turn-helix transcriptional regulator [Mycobacteriales bacterium]|nr:MarR family winged helix-turn-helix transcriptional regulator [Mycobacteriales bacterium]